MHFWCDRQNPFKLTAQTTLKRPSVPLSCDRQHHFDATDSTTLTRPAISLRQTTAPHFGERQYGLETRSTTLWPPTFDRLYRHSLFLSFQNSLRLSCQLNWANQFFVLRIIHSSSFYNFPYDFPANWIQQINWSPTFYESSFLSFCPWNWKLEANQLNSCKTYI